MIQLSADAGVLLVGAASVFVVAWGVFFSTNTAVRGTTWAREHLASFRPVLVVLMILAAAFAFAARPVVFGAALIYMVLMLGALVWALGRNFERLALLGGAEELDRKFRSSIIRRARRITLVGGPSLLVVGGLLALVYFPLGAVVALLGILVSVNGVLLRLPNPDENPS